MYAAATAEVRGDRSETYDFTALLVTGFDGATACSVALPGTRAGVEVAVGPMAGRAPGAGSAIPPQVRASTVTRG